MLSAIVPNRDGRELLARTLPALIEALEFCGERWELIVVDDGSRDGSAEFLRENFPQAKVVALERSLGFIGAVHAGVREAKGDLLLLFNNDVLPERDFLPPLLEHFSDPTTFAASPVVGAWLDDGRLVRQKPLFSRPIIPFVAPGGAGLLDREKFKALGGFDPLFKPFYWEDVDLNIRALRRGWRTVLDPRSVVYHREATTIRRFYNRLYVERIRWRSFFLLTWKDYLDWGLLGKILLGLPMLFADDALVCGGPVGSLAALLALLRMPGALARRLAERLCSTKGRERLLTDLISLGPPLELEKVDAANSPADTTCLSAGGIGRGLEKNRAKSSLTSRFAPLSRKGKVRMLSERAGLGHREGSVLILKILRARYDEFMPHLILRLKAVLPGRELLFVAPPRAMRWLPFGKSEVREIIPAEGVGLHPHRVLRLLQELRARRVREVVLVYDNRSPFGYLKMEALALLLGRPEFLVFVREEGPWRRSRWWLLWRVSLGTAYLAFNLLASLVYTFLLAVLIGIFDLLTLPLVSVMRRRARAE